ncbi:MAG: hypothetical protein A3E26_02445 [Chlamydiae bacterium RIFCSPHIGHO2_12_FULL_49_32]|nr:MAG: hypothetical protein A3E26_02445 [Chlamydiae bacterium RIFCSPHIGHO2_12_FULL_49_32]
MKLLLSVLFLLSCSVAQTSPVIVGELEGQLGNQCFQIAAALSLAWDHDACSLFPDLAHKPSYGIPTNYRKVFWRLPVQEYGREPLFAFQEPHFHYSPLPYVPNMRLKGFFQSEKYFKKYREKIVSLFAPSSEILDYLHTKYAAILEHPQTVSIHIRNYSSESLDENIYPFHGRAYVQKAMTLFPKESLFVVFSNDMAWCKEHLQGLAKEMRFIEGETHYHDFYLMSLCKHHIITNSTFSWWAAYLNQNPQKIVVAPLKWFNPGSGRDTKDLIPPEWIRL